MDGFMLFLHRNRSRGLTAPVLLAGLICLLISLACSPLVTEFAEIEEALLYTAVHPQNQPAADTLTTMTWNIRFAAGRQIPWFGDSCGDRVILTENEVYSTLQGIAEQINLLQPDILLIQEIDIESKRTAYIDEVQWLLDHTHLSYGTYASMWQAQYVPSDGLGRINTGSAILSRWPLHDAERIQLPLRGDQDALTRYFYLRRNILKARIELPGHAGLWVLNIHADAFSTDDTKHKHIIRFKEELDKLAATGAAFIAGGDFNMLPPGSDSTDFCDEDRCPDEHFHGPGDTPFHKEGSCYTPEHDWLNPMYDTYLCSVPLNDYLANPARYYTHTTDRHAAWDRKIDYLFSNKPWLTGSSRTHQEIVNLSDHIPVSARWVVSHE
jgi:endonuclease/exonuclease/phosphatase family metal-dependent hydrolase